MSRGSSVYNDGLWKSEDFTRRSGDGPVRLSTRNTSVGSMNSSTTSGVSSLGTGLSDSVSYSGLKDRQPDSLLHSTQHSSRENFLIQQRPLFSQHKLSTVNTSR